MRFITVLILLPSMAFAGGPEVEQETKVVTGDVNVVGESGTALGLGHALGDVDIAQCLGSTQWDTILGGRQKLVLNNVCMAEFYLNNGKWKLAAMALCNQPEILSEFSTEAECEEAHNFNSVIEEQPVIVPTPGPLNEVIYAQQQIIEEHEEEYESLEARLARIERGNRIASQKAQARRDYAKQTIERLENDPED